MADGVAVDHVFVQASELGELLNQGVEIVASQAAEQHRGPALLSEGNKVPHVERGVRGDQHAECASLTALSLNDSNAVSAGGGVRNNVDTLQAGYLPFSVAGTDEL